MPTQPVFTLAFHPSRIDEYASRYMDIGDDKAAQAGSSIRNGNYTRENLETIFCWKTGGRGKSRLNLNSDEEIRDVLQIAVTAATDRSALAVLCGLNGVDLPVASAILTAIFPNRYTVLDFRALEALGQDPSTYSINFYIAYLSACKNLVSLHELSGLRHLDQALWQWSKEKAAKL